MRKQIRNLIISICVIAVLVAGLVFVKISPIFKTTSSSSSATSSGMSIKLFSGDASKISAIAVTNKEGQYTINRTGSNSFSIAELKSAPAVQTSLSGAVTDAANLNATDIVEENAGDKSKYGLTKPQATLTITDTQKKDYVFEIGNKTPSSSGYYLCEKGKSKVYIATVNVEDYFLSGPLKFVDTSLISLDQQKDVPNITKFLFGGTKRPQTIEIDRTGEAASSSSSSSSTLHYSMVSPQAYSADSDKMSSLTSSIVTLSGESAISVDTSTASLQKYGLLNPSYNFSYILNGKETTLLFGNTVKDGSTDYVYLMLKGRNVIYRIASSVLSFYNWDYTQFVSRMLFNYNIYDVKTVTVKSGTNTWKLDLSGSDDSFAAKYNSKTLDVTNFKSYYQVLIAIQSEGSAQTPANGQVVCSVRLDFKDSKRAAITEEFVKINDRQCFWRINGKGNFYVLKTDVDKLLSDTLNVINGKTVKTTI